MNKVVLLGRLTRDPEVRYRQGEKPFAIAKYTLAVNRIYRNNGKEEADFINCTAFGDAGEFAEKYLKQGTKILVSGRIQTGSYTNKEGQKVYTTEVIVDEQEFAESKKANENGGSSWQNTRPEPSEADSDGFMNIPEGLDEELPFS